VDQRANETANDLYSIRIDNSAGSSIFGKTINSSSIYVDDWTNDLNLFDLSNKVAVVTGSTRGLGHAIAEAYLAAGASVVISSESVAATEQAEVEFKRGGFERVVGRVCDVTDDLQQQSLLEAAIANFGGIDILVANAGVADGFSGSVDISLGCQSGQRRAIVREDCSCIERTRWRNDHFDVEPRWRAWQHAPGSICPFQGGLGPARQKSCRRVGTL
jgi:hypothetical protein